MPLRFCQRTVPWSGQLFWSRITLTIFLTTGWSISGTAGHFIARKKDVA